MHIVGGIYIERSIFPDRDVIYGSGGRAAAALKDISNKVTLTSFVGKNRIKDVVHQAEHIWDVQLNSYPIPEIVVFTYYHGLSKPVIRPTRLPIESAPLIDVNDDVILQFGMLEGSARVDGKKVIYDPQNPEAPKYFHESGSKAEELVYVLNRGEALKLTGEPHVENAAQKLMGQDSVVAVVIKSGADGAKVYTGYDVDHVHAYATKQVWPIGSGDVFAAVFAHFWGVENLPLERAAFYASRGAALYCGSRQLPLRLVDIQCDDFIYPALVPKRTPDKATIYIAGPFFTMGQLWLVEEARAALMHAGFNIFSPYHDVGLGDAARVVPADIQGIEEADVLLALCDGLDPGTLFEVGYAVKKGMPVVAFSENTTDEAMKMLYGTECKVFRDFTSALYHAQWEALS